MLTLYKAVLLHILIFIIKTKIQTQAVTQRASLTLRTIQKQFYANFRKYFAFKTALRYLCFIQEALTRV